MLSFIHSVAFLGKPLRAKIILYSYIKPYVSGIFYLKITTTV